MSMAQLLEQLQQQPPGSSSGCDVGDLAQQLQECAGVFFGGLSLCKVPAVLVVVHKLYDVIEAAAAATVAAEVTTAAGGVQQAAVDGCRAARQDVAAVLDLLAAQPVVGQMLGEQQQLQQELEAVRVYKRQLDAICKLCM